LEKQIAQLLKLLTNLTLLTKTFPTKNIKPKKQMSFPRTPERLRPVPTIPMAPLRPSRRPHNEEIEEVEAAVVEEEGNPNLHILQLALPTNQDQEQEFVNQMIQNLNFQMDEEVEVVVENPNQMNQTNQH
jgi:hypothetical protein